MSSPKTRVDHVRLQALERADFAARQPFPWLNVHGLLHAEAFEALCRDFPPLSLFEKHEGRARSHSQRPHNRYYLAYERSIYAPEHHALAGGANKRGIVCREQLSPSWRDFVQELDQGPYRDMMARLLGVDEMTMRFAWHVAGRGCDVSPHLDAAEKVGTHIFYFNRSSDWRPEWGGATLVLAGKRVESMNPEVADFAAVEAMQVLDNHSFLFKNSPQAWHGVAPLNCPEQHYRRLFNVIIEHPTARLPSANPAPPRQRWWLRWLDRVRPASLRSNA